MTAEPAKIAWSWRHAIARSSLPAETRHVLLTLSLKMDDTGSGCHPPISELVELTGRDKKTVMKHLGIAVDKGWIVVGQHGYRGQRWKRNEYTARWPERDIMAPTPAVHDRIEDDGEGGGPLPPPSDVVEAVPEGGGTDAPKVVEHVHQDKILPETLSQDLPVEREARARAGHGSKPAKPDDDPRPWEHDPQFLRAMTSWGLIDSIASAWREWDPLSPDQRNAAERRIPIYQARHASRSKRVAFSTYLRERTFEHLPDPATVPASANAAASMMIIDRYLRDWWAIFNRRWRAPPEARDHRTGRRQSDLALSMLRMALEHRCGISLPIEEAPTDGERAALVAVDRGSEPYRAWVEHLRDAGYRIDDDLIAGQRIFMPSAWPPDAGQQDEFSMEGAGNERDGRG